MTTRMSPPGGPGLLRTHAWLVVVVTLLTVWVAFAAASHRPVTYTGTAQVIVQTPPTSRVQVPPEMGSEREIASSGRVAALAADALDVSQTEAVKGLSVSVITDTSVLSIHYTAPSARQAYNGCDAFTQAYLDYRNSAQTARVVKVISDPEVPSGSSGWGSLQVILAVALLLGLAIGAGAAWVWDRVTGRVRSLAEFERTGIPVIGSLSSTWNPTGNIEDDFARLAVRLNSLTEGRRRKVRILVTSPRSTNAVAEVAIGTADALAALGRRIVLVDADPGTAEVTRLLAMSDSHGFVEVLEGACQVEHAMQPTARNDVQVVPSGGGDREQTGLPNVDNLEMVLGMMSSDAIVVMAGPSLLDDAQAALIAGTVDVVLVVADLNRTLRTDIDAAALLTAPEPGRLVGWVTYHPSRRAREHSRRGRPADAGPPKARAARLDRASHVVP
jgi:tyrosine-protein kinase